ncbi:hypothetical protein L6164_029127 [Bauhinia variegata]|uniref:Uncharacterized protein n=1 Tax=Bauhinia variegata TaxID=167791 RepID=A0ACB9L8L5_BAUVA|nr:hypothetical protein L6164_029127 [Bauhinia variegata]
MFLTLNLNGKISHNMPSFNYSLSSILHISIIGFFLLLSPCRANDTFKFYNCTGNDTFAPNSPYQINLNTLLTSLSATASASGKATGFNTTVVGGANQQDTVYGLFMCSGSANTQQCSECVANATKEITSLCAFKMEALVWFTDCLVRYSSWPFFAAMDEKPMRCVNNKEDYRGEIEEFNEDLKSLMEDLINQASGNLKKRAGNRRSLPGDKVLYGLAQCIPDLSSDNCSKCLEDAVNDLQNSCTKDKIGGRILYPSCMVRYESYIFFSTSLLKGKSKTPYLEIAMIVVAIFILLLIFYCGYRLVSRKKRKINLKDLKVEEEDISNEMKSLQFDLGTIEAATNNFSDEDKIGEGGFGSVHKGKLSNGEEIAVKRLSRNSSQGDIEFKNEALLIAKLQHRNLVRLLGFCTEGEEKILVYEFVQNKSLDYHLFNRKSQRCLTWAERYRIIGGIARGILYLHEDSRLKIIHRDLKPSNILLDSGMNAKISDFGLARIVGLEEREGSTRRIAGTYGYMSPEYAMHGLFSVKSDVFSFGVMVLEIISGKRNAYFQEPNSSGDLLSHAWKLWREERPLALLDPALEETVSETEVIRCIQIGLLCVQENPDDRPTMATIALYFSFSVDLPMPSEPPLFLQGKAKSRVPMEELESMQSVTNSVSLSVSDISRSKSFPR